MFLQDKKKYLRQIMAKKMTKNLKTTIPILLSNHIHLNIIEYFKLLHNLGGKTSWEETVQWVQSFEKLFSDMTDSLSCGKLPHCMYQAKRSG